MKAVERTFATVVDHVACLGEMFRKPEISAVLDTPGLPGERVSPVVTVVVGRGCAVAQGTGPGSPESATCTNKSSIRAINDQVAQVRAVAYRIELSVLPFLISGFAALLIAWLTVGGLATMAALSKPARALRYE